MIQLNKNLKRVTVVLAMIVALTWFGKWFLFDLAPAIPKSSTSKISLPEIRLVASSLTGQLPLRLNIEEVAQAPYSRNLVFAGGGFQNHLLHFSSLQIVFADKSIVVDPVHNEAFHHTHFPDSYFDNEAYERIQSALLKSSLILATHEHLDHVGGILLSQHLDSIEQKVRLTLEQREGLDTDPDVQQIKKTENSNLFSPLDFENHLAIAPGIVLIKAPGHTPGSQMVYVKLQNGTEYLLTGDIAWHFDNIKKLVGRSRLANLITSEDRDEVSDQLRLLHDLDRDSDVQILVSHDREQHAEYIREGLLGAKFE